MLKKGIICFSLLIFSTSIFSQRFIIYDHNYLHNAVYNPAYTGANDDISINLSVKKQWLGINNSASTQVISLEGKAVRFKKIDPKAFLPKKRDGNVGVGAVFYHDNNGFESYTGGQLSYSYHFAVSKKTKLSFGLSATLTQYRVDEESFTPYDKFDKLLSQSNENLLIPDFSFGVLFYQKDKFQVGFSISELIKSRIKPKNSFITKNTRNVFLSGNITLPLGPKFKIVPSLLFRNTEGLDITVESKVKIVYNSIFFYSQGYRYNEAILFYLGFKKKQFLFGYAYDYSLSKIMNYNYGSNMLFFTYQF